MHIWQLKCSDKTQAVCFLRSACKRRHTTSLIHKTRWKYLKTQPKLSRAAAVKILGEYSGCFRFCKHYKTLLIFENIPQQTRSGGKNLELPEYSVSYFWKLWCFVFSARFHRDSNLVCIAAGLARVPAAAPVLKACGVKPSCSERDHIHQGTNPHS